MKAFLSPAPIWFPKGLALVRIALGLQILYHGLEVFSPETMRMYADWDAFKGENGLMMVYAGKSTELVSGILISLGFFTRIGCLLMMGALSYVTFFVGSGKFWYQDQHPFMFVLFGLLFIFTGPGTWSLDSLFFKDKK